MLAVKLALTSLLFFLQISEGVRSEIFLNLAPPSCSDLFQPRVEVLIEEKMGSVAFSYFAQQGCGNDFKVVADDKVVLVVVRNHFREEIWKLEAASVGGPSGATVTYGIVPAGFVQAIPKVGRPPALRKNEEYYVEVLGQGRGAASFIYHGVGTHSVRN